MVVSHKSLTDKSPHIDTNVKNTSMRVLISPEEGWEGYVMRILEIGKGGYSPRHIHDWPHINYIIRGKGKLHMDGTDYEICAGSYAYIPANIIHQFMNTGEDTLEFICIVPEEGHK